jgi:hypothetical protein
MIALCASVAVFNAAKSIAGGGKFDAMEENLQPYGVEFMAQLHRIQALQARLISKTAINAKQPSGDVVGSRS